MMIEKFGVAIFGFLMLFAAGFATGIFAADYNPKDVAQLMYETACIEQGHVIMKEVCYDPEKLPLAKVLIPLG